MGLIMNIMSMEYIHTQFSQKEMSELTLSDRDYVKSIHLLKNPNISEIAKKQVYKNISYKHDHQIGKEGYVERVKSETDKREISVQLTEKGLFLFMQKEKIYDETLKEIKEVLSDEEFENLELLLEKIGKQLDERLFLNSKKQGTSDLIIPVDVFKKY